MLEFDTSEFEKGFKNWLKEWRKTDLEAKKEAGDTFIHNVATGLGVNTVAPPILTGRLRGSGSAYVAGKKVADTSDTYSAGTPATNNIFMLKRNVIIYFNTEYAARWHENPFNPGPISEMAGDAKDKYVESHLSTDGPELAEKYAEFMKKEVEN